MRMSFESLISQVQVTDDAIISHSDDITPTLGIKFQACTAIT